MKQIFTLTLFLLAALAGFTQGKGKEKTKGKQKTEVKPTVPAPSGQTTKPEVKTVQKPQIFQKADSTKNSSATSKGDNTGSPSASSENKNTNTNASSGTQSSGQTQTSTSTESTTVGQSSNSGAQPQSGQHNSSSSGQTGSDASGSNTTVGNQQGQTTGAENGKGKNKLKGQQNGNGNGNSKTRINIPTQVRNSFNRDYPNAINPVWTKNRGDWTVKFGNNVWNSTATYHSNGERIDTRTPIRRDQTPRPVQDEILKRFPQTNPKDIIKIEKPQNPNLFQVIVEQAGKVKTMIFDEKGKLVSQLQDVIK